MTVDPADILALLEERPYSTHELAVLFGVRGSGLSSLLARMARAGQIEAIPNKRWRLHPTPPPTSDPRDAAQRTASGAPVRQPHERPTTATVKKEGPGSWWIGLDRAQLAQGIARRQEQMQASRQARFIDGGIRE